MTNIKTAISLQKSLFDQAEEIAERMQVSRSRLYSQALEIFIRDYQEKQLFNAINKACSDENNESQDHSRIRQLQHHHRRMVEGEW